MAIITSEAWRNEIKKPFRYSGRVRWSMALTPDLSETQIESSAENALDVSQASDLLNGVSESYNEIATFEGIWRADGSMYLPSSNPNENMELPLISSGAEPLIVQYAFDQEVSFVGLTIWWDSKYLSWPTLYNLKGYDAEGTLKYENKNLTANSTVSVVEVPMDNVSKVELEFLEWSNPQLKVRIQQIVFGIKLDLTEKQIMTISESTKVDRMNAQLPSDTHKFTIKNQIYRIARAGSANAESASSHPATDISRIFNDTLATESLATVETTYWKASGDMYLPSRNVLENPNVAWMSLDGNFSEDSPVEVTIKYDHPFQLNQIKIYWDTVNNTWPEKAYIECRDSYGSVLYSKTFRAEGTSTLFLDFTGVVEYVTLKIYEWCIPGQRARINMFEAQMVYGNNNIESEVNNLFDPTLSVGYSKYLAQRQEIKLEYGLDTYEDVTLWLPVQTSFLDSWRIPTDALNVELQSTTRLAFMTQLYQKGIYQSEARTFKSLALEVLENSNIIRDHTNPEPWILSDKLQELTTTAPLPSMASNALLQLIAGATGTVLSTKPTNGYVQLVDELDEPGYIIDSSIQLQTPSAELSAPLRSIAINLYTYFLEDKETELYSGSVFINGTQRVTVSFKDNTCASNCTVEVEGASVVAQRLYGYYADLEISTSARSEVKITIKGYVVKSSKAQIVTYLNEDVTSGRDIVIDNALVTNMETVEALSEVAYSHYSKRNTIATDYLGFPELKASDMVAVYSTFSNEVGVIQEHSFEFNGAFSGNMKVLMEE